MSAKLLSFPDVTYAGELDMGNRTPQQTNQQTRLERWAQWLGLMLLIATLGGLILNSSRENEHRLTQIETKADLTSTNTTELVRAQKESNSFSYLSLQTNQVVLEILLKMNLPREDRRKAQDKLAEIKARKISQAGESATGNVPLISRDE
jgi:hypothetical protein